MMFYTIILYGTPKKEYLNCATSKKGQRTTAVESVEILVLLINRTLIHSHYDTHNLKA